MMSICRPLFGRSVARIVLRPTPVVLHRWNSSIAKDSKVSLAAQVYPINKEEITEEDVDEWLSAIKKLKNGVQNAESSTEIYLAELSKPAQHLTDKFEASEQQKQELQNVSGVAIPLYRNQLVESVVNFIMRNGKKLKAQKIVDRSLYIVGLKTRKDPLAVLEETITKLSPLFSTRTQKTGTAKNRIVPYPLNKKQRHRFAIKWIIEGSDKKKSNDMSVRLAEEIINAYEGKLPGFEKKAAMHKLALAQRSFITL